MCEYACGWKLFCFFLMYIQCKRETYSAECLTFDSEINEEDKFDSRRNTYISRLNSRIEDRANRLGKDDLLFCCRHGHRRYRGMDLSVHGAFLSSASSQQRWLLLPVTRRCVLVSRRIVAASPDDGTGTAANRYARSIYTMQSKREKKEKLNSFVLPCETSLGTPLIKKHLRRFNNAMTHESYQEKVS